MKIKFEHVVDGINRYINKEIYCNLNSTQEFLARLVVGRISQNANIIKKDLMHNGFFKTLGVVDSEGLVDIEDIMQIVKQEIERQESLQVDVPLIGVFTFKPDDVDKLYEEIVRRENYEAY